MEKTCLAASTRNIIYGTDKRVGFHPRKGKVMAEAGLCIAWGDVVKGSEKRALEAYGESMQYFGRLQEEGRIERFEVVVLGPTGGDVGGFWLLRGTEEQIDSVRRSEDYVALIQRVQLVVTGLRIADAFLDEGLVQVMGNYQKLVDELDLTVNPQPERRPVGVAQPQGAAITATQSPFRRSQHVAALDAAPVASPLKAAKGGAENKTWKAQGTA